MLDANDPKLTAYVLGELDDEQCRAVEAELARSPELKQAVAALRRTTELVGEALAAEPCEHLWPDQQAAIHRQAELPVAVERPQSRPAWLGLLAVAASLLLIFGVTMLVKPGLFDGAWVQPIELAGGPDLPYEIDIAGQTLPDPTAPDGTIEYFAPGDRNSGGVDVQQTPPREPPLRYQRSDHRAGTFRPFVYREDLHTDELNGDDDEDMGPSITFGLDPKGGPTSGLDLNNWQSARSRRGAAPFTDEPPINYPDQETWDALTRRRQHFQPDEGRRGGDNGEAAPSDHGAAPFAADDPVWQYYPPDGGGDADPNSRNERDRVGDDLMESVGPFTGRALEGRGSRDGQDAATPRERRPYLREPRPQPGVVAGPQPAGEAPAEAPVLDPQGGWRPLNTTVSPPETVMRPNPQEQPADAEDGRAPGPGGGQEETTNAAGDAAPLVDSSRSMAPGDIEPMLREVEQLEKELQQTQDDRDAQFENSVRLADKITQLSGIERRLESRRQSLEELAAERDALSAQIEAANQDGDDSTVEALPEMLERSKSIEQQIAERQKGIVAEAKKLQEALADLQSKSDADRNGTQPNLDAVVTAVSDHGLIELSVGSDDGLKEGHHVNVFRGETLLGRAVVRRTATDRAVAELDGLHRPNVKRGDRVASTGKPTPRRTWRRAKATPNAARLVVGERDELLAEGVQANVTIDGFRARVLLDYYYFNNRDQQLEGAFKLRLPDEASLYYFAFGQTSIEYRPEVDELAHRGFMPVSLVRTSGTGPEEILQVRSETWSEVKEARVVPREKAAHAYSETVRRRVDPALVEWSGAGVFQAKVFPLIPNKLHRIVVGYDVNLRRDGDDLVFELDLPEGLPECQVDVNVAAAPGTSAEVVPTTEPFTSAGRAFYHVKPADGEPVRVRIEQPGTVLLVDEVDEKPFFATRFVPDLPEGKATAGSSEAVFLLDTSLSSNPAKFNVYLDLMTAILDENREQLRRFAVLRFDVEAQWWRREYVDNTPENVAAVLNWCHTIALEGATDLQLAIREAASPSWPEEKRSTDSSPDFFLLSDGAVTWGELDLHAIGRSLRSGQAGSLFAYKTGLTGTAIGVLEHLARETGGAVFAVATEQEVAAAATAHRRRPWQVLATSVDGGGDLLLAGRPKTIYPGQQLLLVGRGRPAEGAQVELTLRRGQQQKIVGTTIDRAIESELTARTYGQVAVGQLEDLGDAIEDVSVAFARHFRVTGRTCSLLMLESEADYQRFNIKPEDDAFVVGSTPAAELIVRQLDALADRLGDPKAATLAWLAKLERTPGVQFQTPTALRLALDRLPVEAFEVDVPRMQCKQSEREQLAKKYFEHLQADRLDYDTVWAEAEKRREQHSPADGLKALSSLIENSPGDPVLAGDIAFSAIDWGLAGQAYPLLKRVATMRPYQPHTYLAIGQCLTELGRADLALVYYEVALAGRWHERYRDVHRIAAIEYVHLLQQVERGKLSSHVPDYAKARLASLTEQYDLGRADLVVTMMWNTDRTDVDLHVIEPSGEECYYQHTETRSGGRITPDVTEGFGPEMYLNRDAPHGKYAVKANYYGSDANRTQVRTKVHLTIYRYFGDRRQQVQRRSVALSRQKEKRDVAEVLIEK